MIEKEQAREANYKKKFDDFSKISFNRRLKNIWMISTEKNCMINNTTKEKLRLKTQILKRRETKNEAFIKTFLTKFRKKKSKNEIFKCKKCKKMKK